MIQCAKSGSLKIVIVPIIAVDQYKIFDFIPHFKLLLVCSGKIKHYPIKKSYATRCK